MIINWDGKQYQYDPRAIDVKTAIVIKDRTGWGMRTWERAVDDCDPLALQLLLWAIKGQNGEPCDPSTLDFPVVVLYEEMVRASLEEIKRLEAAKGKGKAAKSGRTRKQTQTSDTTGTNTSTS